MGDQSGVFVENDMFYRFGENVNRTRLFDKEGNAVTKSCHVCQDQHITFQCAESENCSRSFCRKCTEKYHSDLSFEEIMKCCPSCRGVCSCRKCLRKTCDPKTVLPQDDFENRQYAEKILSFCGPLISDILTLYDKECEIHGVSLEDVVVFKRSGLSFSCDICCTSIADFHFGCENCTGEDDGGREICVSCVGEYRAKGDAYLLNKQLTCSSCGSRLIPRRLIPDKMLDVLRQISKQYPGCQEDVILPVFNTPRELVRCLLKVSRRNRGKVQLQLGVEVESWKQEECWKRLEERNLGIKDEDGIEWREAGFGNSILVIDAHKCSEATTLKLLQRAMLKGEPLVVKNVHGRMDWRPQTMTRVFSEKLGYVKQRREHENLSELPDPSIVCVHLCSKEMPAEEWSQRLFFKEYEKNDSTKMYKIKDWPPDASFAEKLPRHNQDFIEMLPCPSYTNPISGMLNLTRALPEDCCRPDIGPKTYLATGRLVEKNDDTDSVTRLHLDMSDALNVLLHSQKKPSELTVGGAVWNIIGRRDIWKITDYLKDKDAILERRVYLKARDRESLVQEHGVQMWTFYQDDNEAVYVPSGCPHQVRNTRSCLKVAVDFFSPESAPVVMRLGQELRDYGKRAEGENRDDAQDTLQGHATIFHACIEAFKIKRQEKKRFRTVHSESPVRRPTRSRKKRRTRL